MTDRRPFIIGLTGSIGMGKTETGKMFEALGIPRYDADAVVHGLYARGGVAVAAIEKTFPGTVTEGQVNRDLLAAQVKTDDKAFQRLEAIVHPLTTQARAIFLEEAAADGADMVLLDIPLLFEIGADKLVDTIVVVSAPEHVQHARVLARPGMTLERLEALKARQIPDAEKRARADFVIETDKGFDHAQALVRNIIAQLRAKPVR